MSVKLLKEEGLAGFVERLREKSISVRGPRRNDAGMVVYEEVTGAGELELEEVIGRYSPKDAFFPQHETILRYRQEGNKVDVKPEVPEIKETVLLGVRPCDAAAMISLNKVFTWDYIDNLFTERKNKAVILSFACNKADESCFCTSVGCAPDSTTGSDILFRKAKKGGYLAEAVTEEGEKILQDYKDLFTDAGGVESEPVAEVPLMDAKTDKIKVWLDDKGNFEHKIWEEMSAKCVGCGGCTFVCPTCHCFDIVDEPYGDQGKRVKNWDGCQFDHFTLHASGHNPREHQPQRWRNRFSCKFKIYPDRFEGKGCVGCGRCIRVCPVNVDITEAMTDITEMSA